MTDSVRYWLGQVASGRKVLHVRGKDLAVMNRLIQCGYVEYHSYSIGYVLTPMGSKALQDLALSTEAATP